MPDPVREVCETLEEFVARRDYWSSQSLRLILPFEDPDEGCLGFITIADLADKTKPPPSDWSEDEHIVRYYFFGRALTPEARIEREAKDIEEFLNTHRGHPQFRFAGWPQQRMLGAVCYCQAHEGKSLLLQIPLTTVKGLTELGREIYEGHRAMVELYQRDPLALVPAARAAV